MKLEMKLREEKKMSKQKQPKKVDVLKIDLDAKSKKSAIETLWVRLAYFNDVDFLHFDIVDKIILFKKTTYGCKIYLKQPLPVMFSIHLELLLGDDWRRNVNVLLNYKKYKMIYYDRLFDIKVYPDGSTKIAKKEDITSIIKDKVHNPNRGIYYT